jgi:hypothetical protein
MFPGLGLRQFQRDGLLCDDIPTLPQTFSGMASARATS